MLGQDSSLKYVLHDHRWAVIAAWLAVALVLKLVAPEWSQVARDGDLDQLPADTAIAQGELLNAQAFPDDVSKSQVVLVCARPQVPLSFEDRDYAVMLGQAIGEALGPHLVDVWTEKTPAIGPTLRSRSGQAVRAVVRLTNEFMATENISLLSQVRQVVADLAPGKPEGLQVGITGSAAIGGDMLSAAAESVSNTHTTTILLVTIALTVIYRSPTLVLVPLLAIGIATTISMDLLAVLAMWSKQHPGSWPTIQIFTTTKIFVIVLLFGSGTDYCLFLTARYRELRGLGRSIRHSLGEAVEHVGIALIASALTTIVGLAMMGFAQFGKFAYSGPAIAICLGVTLLDCLTLVPALLATRLGSSIRHTPSSQPADRWHQRWETLAELVLRRPGTILTVCLVLAMPIAWYGWQVDTTYDLLGELAPDRVSRQGTDLLRQHFPPGDLGPVVLLAQHPAGNLDSVDGQILIAQLAKPLEDLDGVDRVRSLHQPLGDPAGTARLFSSEGLFALAAKGSPLTQSVYVSQSGPYQGRVTRLFLSLSDQPFSKSALHTCDAIDQVLNRLHSDPNSPWQRATFAMLGPTVGIRDLQRITHADRVLIQWLVTLAVLLVILVLLRRLVISLFLIFSVVLSYLITIGASDLLFSFLRGEAYAGLDWKVPLFLFVLLVAVGQDYNIYLVSRVLEEQRRLGPREGLREALIQTGGIITSCGVIMAGTFVSMTTSQLAGMIELGFALTLGILLDTFAIRSVFVPAMLALLIKLRL